MTSLKALQRRAREARHWLMDACFPLWAETGVSRSGVFIDALHLNHRAPDDTASASVVTQARQTSLFAIAFGQGWQPDRSLELCRAGLECLTGPALRGDGRPGARIDASGDGLIDTSTSAETGFELLRTHARILANLPELADRAEAGSVALRAALSQGAMDAEEAAPASDMPTELAWAEAWPERYDRARLREAAGRLPEALAPAPAWRVFEIIDWLWRAGRLGEDVAGEQLSEAYLRALADMDDTGRLSHGEDREHHARDQALALRAHLAMMESRLCPGADRSAALAFDTLMDENLTFEGGWIARHGADGLPLDQDMPAGLGLDIAGAFLRLLEGVEA